MSRKNRKLPELTPAQRRSARAAGLSYAEARRDDRLDRAEYTAMSAVEREAHDNR